MSQIKVPAITRLQSTQRNQPSRFKITACFDRQNVAATSRLGVTVRRTNASIEIAPGSLTTKNRSDKDPKKISAKRNNVSVRPLVPSWFITKTVRKIGATVIVTTLSTEKAFLKVVVSFHWQFGACYS